MGRTKSLLILLSFATLALTTHAANSLLPRPNKVVVGEGGFVFTPGIPVIYAPGLEALAEYITEYIPLRQIDDRTWTAGQSLRLLVDETLGEEAYRLEITPQGVRVTGGDYANTEPVTSLDDYYGSHAFQLLYDRLCRSCSATGSQAA